MAGHEGGLPVRLFGNVLVKASGVTSALCLQCVVSSPDENDHRLGGRGSPAHYHQ